MPPLWARVLRRVSSVIAVALAAALLLTTVAPSLAAGPGVDPRLATRLQAVLDAVRTKDPLPGISAAVDTPAGLWTGVSGKSRLAPSQPMRPDTPLSIGSVTKTFVAAVILQLREEGRLSLGDHLSRWETRVPNAGRITVRQLLSHTSGVRDMWWSPRYTALVEGRPGHVWTYPEVRSLIGAPRFSPGTRFEYSNSNFVLLGRIIEEVTGHSVAREIRDRLLDPLGLDSTWYQGAESGPRTVAMGYLRRNGAWIPQGDGTGLRPTTSIATFFGAAGAIVSTPGDLAIWARALYGGHVLQASSLELMTTFNSHKYGLGTRRLQMGGRVAWGHGGSLDGFETSMWFLPRLETSVVVIWNRRGLDTDPVADRLARRVVSTLDPDVSPPTLGAPQVTLRTHATVGTGFAPVVVTWPTAHDSQGSIAKYQVRRRTAGGVWQAVPLGRRLAHGVSLHLRLRHAWQVEVRATDDRGNSSHWVAAAPFVVHLIDDTDAAVVASDGWRTVKAPTALGGTVLRSGSPGSHLSLGIHASAVAVVGPWSRSLTRPWVRFDDQPGTIVSVRLSAHRPRQTLLAHRWSGSVRDHRVRILVRNERHTRVDIDGFLILTAPAASR